MTKEQRMVSMNDLQLALGIAWPPADRFVDEYGFGKQIVYDRMNGMVRNQRVPENVAEAVVKMFRKEVTVGRHMVHNYQRIRGIDVERAVALKDSNRWKPSAGYR